MWTGVASRVVEKKNANRLPRREKARQKAPSFTSGGQHTWRCPTKLSAYDILLVTLKEVLNASVVVRSSRLRILSRIGRGG